jgi:hypothetical protein
VTSELKSRRPLILILDGLLVFLVALSIFIALSGGFRAVVLGVILSARGIWRPVALALVIGAIRLGVAGRAPLFMISRETRRRLCHRVYRTELDDVSGASGSRSIARTVLAAAGICAVCAVLLFPQLRHMESVPDFGDPLLSTWRMGWVYEQLRGDPRRLFDANIFYPEPLTFTYSDSMLLPGATAAPLLAVGVRPIVAYNLLFISGFVLSGLAAYLLVERLTGSAPAAFVSGLVFGFYPYHFEHYSHLELQMMQWMPLALLAIHRFLATARVRYAVAATICVTAQLYSSMYYAVFFVLYAAVVMAVLLLSVRPAWRRMLAPIAVAAVVGIVLAIPIVRAYSASTKIKGERGINEVEIFSAEPADYLRAHPRSALYANYTLPGRRPERALFPGLVPIALAAVGMAPPIGLARVAYTAGLLLAFDGSLGFNGVSYPYLYQWFMPIRGLRVPARFSVLVALSLAVLSGYGARRLLDRSRSPVARRLTFAMLIVAAAANPWPVLDLRPVWPEPPPVYGALAGARHVVLAEFPIEDDFVANTRYMYFSVWHWSSMVNGYSGYMPDSYDRFARSVRGFPAPEAISALKAKGITHVTVNCAFYRRSCPDWLERIDAVPDLHRVADGRWQGSVVRLYEVVK